MSALTLAAVDYILCCTALRDSTGSYEQAEARLSEIAKYSGDIPREQIVEVIEAWLGTGEKITRGERWKAGATLTATT